MCSFNTNKKLKVPKVVGITDAFAHGLSGILGLCHQSVFDVMCTTADAVSFAEQTPEAARDGFKGYTFTVSKRKKMY